MREQELIEMQNYLNMHCEAITERYNLTSDKDPIAFEVLRYSDLSKDENISREIAQFYDVNWTGNRDFMHIPDFVQVARNIREFPVIIARRMDSREILGMATIKYYENNEIMQEYYPKPFVEFFSITGVLVKKEIEYRGIGKKINEIAIKGAADYAERHPGVEMIAEIDCRNRNSLNATASALENIAKEGRNFPSDIYGYYELRSEDGKLKEAPTLILSIGLEEGGNGNVEKKKLGYEGHGSENLSEYLLQTLKRTFHSSKKRVTRDGNEMLYFTYLNGDDRITGLEIEPGGTEKGNDREPTGDWGQNFIGPLQMNFIEESER